MARVKSQATAVETDSSRLGHRRDIARGEQPAEIAALRERGVVR
jgi:hypothetical protein